jgi:hypothetical protein
MNIDRHIISNAGHTPFEHALNSTEVCSIQVKGAAPEHTQIDRDSGPREDATMRKGLMPAAGAHSRCLAEHETCTCQVHELEWRQFLKTRGPSVVGGNLARTVYVLDKGKKKSKIPFLPIAVSTSGRVYEDFERLLFLHAHREASILAGELPE